MELIIEREGKIVIFKIASRLDSLSAPKVEKALLPAIETHGDYLMDMTALEHISSAGLRVLLLAAKKIRSTESRMVLFGMSDAIRDIFDIAGFSTIFEIVDGKEDAVKELAV